MKNLTNYSGILRCINKYTLDYVEIPCPRGQDVNFRFTLFDFASAYCGNLKVEFHYYALYSENTMKNGELPICGIKLYPKEEYKSKFINLIDNNVYLKVFSVDLETNKFILNEDDKELLRMCGIKDIYNYIERNVLS